MKKHSLKHFLGFAGLMTMVLLALSGCGKKKEITLWNPFTGSDGDYFNKIVKKYNATDPEMKVKSVTVPDMYTKIYTVMNAKKDSAVPDLTVMHIERIPLFKSQKMIVPIEAALKDEPKIKSSNYISQAWNAGEVDGKRYSVPLDVHSSVMYYNKDLLKKYAPNALDDNVITIDEIKEITAKAKEDKIVTYPINVESWVALALTTDLGGSVENDGMPDIDTKEMTTAVTTLRDLVKIGAAQEDGDDVAQLFQSGKSVFQQDGTWYSGTLNKIDDLNWGVTNTPAYTPDKITNWTSSHQFGLLKKKRDDATMKGIGKFLEFVRTHSTDWADSGQNVASREVFDEASYAKRPQAFLMAGEKEKKSMMIYDFKNNGNMLDGMNTNLRDIIYSRKSVKKGLEEAQKSAEAKSKEGNKK